MSWHRPRVRAWLLTSLAVITNYIALQDLLLPDDARGWPCHFISWHLEGKTTLWESINTSVTQLHRWKWVMMSWVVPLQSYSCSWCWYICNIVISRRETWSVGYQLQQQHREGREAEVWSGDWWCRPVPGHPQPRPGGRADSGGLQRGPGQTPGHSPGRPPHWRSPRAPPLLDETLVALSDPSQVSAREGHLSSDRGENWNLFFNSAKLSKCNLQELHQDKVTTAIFEVFPF